MIRRALAAREARREAAYQRRKEDRRLRRVLLNQHVPIPDRDRARADAEYLRLLDKVIGTYESYFDAWCDDYDRAQERQRDHEDRYGLPYEAKRRPAREARR